MPVNYGTAAYVFKSDPGALAQNLFDHQLAGFITTEMVDIKLVNQTDGVRHREVIGHAAKSDGIDAATAVDGPETHLEMCTTHDMSFIDHETTARNVAPRSGGAQIRASTERPKVRGCTNSDQREASQSIQR